MMSALSKALDEVRFRIPKPILEAVFSERGNGWELIPTTIEDRILYSVIRPRVLVDCNLLGGTEINIPLNNVSYEKPNDFTYVYRIPKSSTQGRSIISVLSLSYGNPLVASASSATAMASAYSGSNAVLQAGAAMMDSFSPMPMVSTAKVQLIGENVVLVRDNVIIPPTATLRCMLSNDENMSHLQLKSFRQFSDAVVFAVKAYIYNEYIIRMGENQLMYGVELSRFKDIVEQYSDSEQNYQDHMNNVMGKVLMMNDQEAYTRFLKIAIGGMR